MEIVTDPKVKFQEEAFREKRIIQIRSFIDPDDFDYLAKQIGQSFDIEHNQDMFVFNLLHGIGHFELNLWKKKYDDPIFSSPLWDAIRMISSFQDYAHSPSPYQ